jgi:NAD(P)H-nitrite reductase large subunit
MEDSMKTRIVIIGAGPAGVTAVETLRAYNRESEIIMLSAEPYPPYSPPAMVDHFIRNSNAHLWLDEGWMDRMGVIYSGLIQQRSMFSPPGMIHSNMTS